MDNLVLNQEFEIEVVRGFSILHLSSFINCLNDAVELLKNVKETAVLCSLDKKAVEYQKYLHNAQHNKMVMEQALTEKEEDVAMPEATIHNVYLN
jgi:hypothetical protein